MKHLHTFDDFLNEKIMKPVISPELQFAQGIAGTNEKIAALKLQMAEKPEQRDFILAKIKVELEKIDSILAKKNLLSAKEFETQRKEREKGQKLRDKVSAKQ